MQKLKNHHLFLILLVGFVAGYFLRGALITEPVAAKLITLQNRNLNYQVTTTSSSLGDFLQEQGFDPESIAQGYDPESAVINGMTIPLSPVLEVSLIDGTETQTITTAAVTVGDLLAQEKVDLSPTDQVAPNLSSYLAAGLTVKIDRVVELEVTEVNPIAFQQQVVETQELPYGREELIQQGATGRIQQNFLITYENGVEIARQLLSEEVVSVPTPEILRVGRRIEVEFSEAGRASWYSFQNCLCGAFPQPARGRYVRVTHLETGQSVVVRINDFGPDRSIHPERVIDLDRVAFSRLDSLGRGTIPVLVELIAD